MAEATEVPTLDLDAMEVVARNVFPLITCHVEQELARFVVALADEVRRLRADTAPLAALVGKLDAGDSDTLRAAALLYDVRAENIGAHDATKAAMWTAMQLRCIADWMDDIRAALAASEAAR